MGQFTNIEWNKRGKKNMYSNLLISESDLSNICIYLIIFACPANIQYHSTVYIWGISDWKQTQPELLSSGIYSLTGMIAAQVYFVKIH